MKHIPHYVDVTGEMLFLNNQKTIKIEIKIVENIPRAKILFI